MSGVPRSPDPVDDLARRAANLLRAGRDPEALPLCQEIVRLRPSAGAWWVNLGTLLRRLGRHEEALAAYAWAAARGESSASFLYNVGLLHQDRGDHESARRVLADALRLAPEDVEIRLQYAQCSYECLHLDAAARALDGWRTLAGVTSEQLATVALLLLKLGESGPAAEAAAVAAAAPQLSPASLIKLAHVHERSNRIAEARSILTRVNGLGEASEPGDELALLTAQLDLREGRHEQAIAGFSALAARCPEPHRRHHHLFPLANALDATGRYEDAWHCLHQAHEAQQLLLARTHPEAAGVQEPPLLITRQGCSSADVSRWEEAASPPASASPVFIVAFPRSGTTLLEQVLDAHPSLVSMDEQPFLQQAIDRIGDLGIEYAAGLACLTPAELDEVRQYYWSLARSKVTLAPGQRLVDKNPLNLLRLPAIRRLFPKARLLLAIRHPCDIVLSCYQQHFLSPEFAVLCRDLPTLARSYRRCFDFWYSQAALLRPVAREVRYERLVEDFPAQARQIMEFLGLDLVPAQLEPAAHARARGYISTPSYSQVIEPVHQRAVGRWERYAHWFGEALPSLQPYLDHWGYRA